MKKIKCLPILLFLSILARVSFAQHISVGADHVNQIISLTHGKNVALVINQTSQLSNGTALLDTLISRKVSIKKIFTPEHGLYGTSDAGEWVSDNKYIKKGIAINSLYGKNYKPSPTQLQDIDFVIFDIQDVGARFYTYISTLHYVMEACAESHKQLLLLDRPNPNDYIDGPVLDLKFKSFVGMEPIPITYGMTLGELAQMINGEHWLKLDEQCNLTVIKLDGWQHGQEYQLPVKPSPNLPNQQAIKLYPSLCLFESTNISVGRGTQSPFQIVGATQSNFGKYTFTPQSIIGAKNPPLKDILCYGIDLRNKQVKKEINLSYIIYFYKKWNSDMPFFKSPKFMDKLAGSSQLRLQIERGMSISEIKKSWQIELNAFKLKRKKYLLYKDYSY